MTTPKKATSKTAAKATSKTVAKKTTAARAPRKAPTTSVVEGAVPAPPPDKTITLAGRVIVVGKPTMDQILAWEGTLHEVAALENKNPTTADIREGLAKVYQSAGDFFEHDFDREWLDLAVRRGKVSIADEEFSTMVDRIAELYKDEMDADAKAAMNRTQKRALARKKK